MIENYIKTDVLVIGGGFAGFFAAIKAREQGQDVVMVDKGYIGNTGQSPYAGTFCLFNPEAGDDLDEWMNFINIAGEYLNNREFTEMCLKDSYDRVQDLISWGVEFKTDEKGNLKVADNNMPIPPAKEGEAQFAQPAMPLSNPLKTVFVKPFQSTKSLRKTAKQMGVKIIDRMMITDLLTKNKKVTGAIGISVEEAELHIFSAKAVILCTGASSFKPNGWPISNLTSDGDAMAYKAGVEITGKEFIDPHMARADYPAYQSYKERPDVKPVFGIPRNCFNEPVSSSRGTLFMDFEFEAHAGRAPITLYPFDPGKEPFQVIGGSTLGMGVHKTEGIWPENTKCETSVKGLYAAGDALGTMQSGTVYVGIGQALLGSAATGARAGISAAEYSGGTALEDLDVKQVEEITEKIYAPLKRKGGFSARWAIQVLQNTLTPYFILYIKHEERLKSALTTIEFLRDHVSPKLFARDAHELRLVIETKNMIFNAEMKLKASIARRESRGCHYREDYPERDDDLLAWINFRESDGKMEMVKRPLPNEWLPDPGKPYEERYPFRFPSE